MFSIASILPFMAVVANPQLIETNNYLNLAYVTFGCASPKYFVFGLGVLVFSVLIIGNLFSALTSWFMFKLSYRQGAKISKRLMNTYLSQPFNFFINKNSGELHKNILAEVDRLVTGIFVNLALTMNKCSVALLILTLLLMVDVKLALTVFAVLGGSYLIIYLLVKGTLSRAGRLSSQVNTERYQLVKEIFGSIKELKVLNRQQNFYQQFSKLADLFAQYEANSQLTPLIVRYIIETIAFGGMLIIAIYFIWTQENLYKILPMLGLYALAGYRLMPAVQQIFSGLTLYRYHSSAIDILYKDYGLPCSEQTSDATLTFHQSIELRNISYQYLNADQKNIENFNCQIKACTRIGLVGMSGAGKTTLVDILLGLLTPDCGKIYIDGKRLDDCAIQAWQKNIGYVPQNIFLSDGSLKQNIAFGIPDDKIAINRVMNAAQMANLHDFVLSELSEGYDTVIGEGGIRLSGGQRQRIGIARALYHDPQLLIFDEATSALDNVSEQVIVETIAQLGHKKTIIIIAHRIQTVKDCDAIYLLDKGQLLASGTYQQLMKTSTKFQHLVIGKDRTAAKLA